MAKEVHAYSIPINEPDDQGSGTVTVLRIHMTEPNARRRAVMLRRLLKQNYGLDRTQSKRALRAMGFDDLPV